MKKGNISIIQEYYQNRSEAVLCCDLTLGITWKNKQANAVYGANINHICTLLKQADVDITKQKMETLLDFKLTVTQGDHDLTLSFHPIIYQDKPLCYFVTILETPRPKPEDVLNDGHHMLALYSYQNRYALANIFNILPFIKNDLERHELYEDVDYLNQLSVNCYAMLKSLLSYNEYKKLSLDYDSFHPVKSDLCSTFNRLLSAVRLLLMRTDISFDYTLPNQLIITEVDVEKLNIAMLHLISNACKYTSPNNGIHVTLQQRKKMIVIIVSDKGVGIHPENFEKIFTPFYSFDPNTNSYAGAGLGLPYVKLVAEMHGGQCIVSSSPNTGTSIMIKFPVRDDDAHPRLQSDKFEYTLGRFSPISVYLSDVCPVPID